ncbi:MAG: Tn3 family transposase, partial [Isosphaeraceae bacterium]
MIDTQIITEQWDRMGQFYASLESGHTTASVALKRLASCTAKNRFYRANRDLGRIFKTEFLLSYLETWGQTLCAPWKGVGLQWVQFPPGNWVAPASSYRSGGGGNEAVGA